MWQIFTSGTRFRCFPLPLFAPLSSPVEKIRKPIGCFGCLRGCWTSVKIKWNQDWLQRQQQEFPKIPTVDSQGLSDIGCMNFPRSGVEVVATILLQNMIESTKILLIPNVPPNIIKISMAQRFVNGYHQKWDASWMTIMLIPEKVCSRN